jgi:glycerophosphoryl diester phosphodiesterase
MKSRADINRPFIWAHRGDSAWAPENTLAAFHAAVESGADGLELDVHLSCDGVPVVIHDETLERTTDGRGLVSVASAEQIARLDAGSWFSAAFSGEPVPTLAAVLKAFGGQKRLNLEIKEPLAGIAVLDLLKRHASADVVVSSFDIDVLCQLRSADRALPIAVLYHAGGWRKVLSAAKGLSACAFHPGATTVSRPMISACKEAGLPVHVWTVDRIPVAKSLFRAGVAGFFSNDPGLLTRAFSPPWQPVH